MNNNNNSDNTENSIERRHYVFLCFLTILNVMNFVDRQLLASFANFIVPDLELTNTQFGLLTGLLFISFYAVMGLFMGALADMVHRPRLVAFGVALWSILTAASGAAKGFVSLAVPRMFIGVGESVLTPTAASASQAPMWARLYVGDSHALARAGSVAPIRSKRGAHALASGTMKTLPK